MTRWSSASQRSPVTSGCTITTAELGDGTLDAQLQDIEDTRGFIAAIEAVDESQLSESNRFERQLALYSSRLALFDDEVHRTWERKTGATDEIGDGIFVLFARTARPFAERFEGMASRLEAAPRVLRSSAAGWERTHSDCGTSSSSMRLSHCPAFSVRCMAAAKSEFGDSSPEVRRAEKAAADTRLALEEYATWLRAQLGRADDEFALGNDNYEELVRLREFDGLRTDDILAIGLEQLDFNKQRRREVAAQIDANVNRGGSARPHQVGPAWIVQRGARRLPAGNGRGARVRHRSRHRVDAGG